jgi:predicted TIM-barrel fold metal-dependent hydrolase
VDLLWTKVEKLKMIIDTHMHLWDKIAGRLGMQKVAPVASGVMRQQKNKKTMFR